jgi:hypothetical protein
MFVLQAWFNHMHKRASEQQNRAPSAWQIHPIAYEKPCRKPRIFSNLCFHGFCWRPVAMSFILVMNSKKSPQDPAACQNLLRCPPMQYWGAFANLFFSCNICGAYSVAHGVCWRGVSLLCADERWWSRWPGTARFSCSADFALTSKDPDRVSQMFVWQDKTRWTWIGTITHLNSQPKINNYFESFFICRGAIQIR